MTVRALRALDPLTAIRREAFGHSLPGRAGAAPTHTPRPPPSEAVTELRTREGRHCDGLLRVNRR